MPNTSSKPRRLARLAAPLLLLTAVGTAAIAMVAPAVAVAAAPAAENPAARAAVEALLESPAAAASTAIPADFSAVLGYAPALAGGLLTNPGGGCSSPVPLPSSFDGPCRAHDLGYDLLRYAELAHGPLGPWARQGIDAQFAARLRERCGTEGCATMASAAAAAVNVNSWRQLYATPVSEPVALYAVGGVGLAGLGLAARRRVTR